MSSLEDALHEVKLWGSQTIHLRTLLTYLFLLPIDEIPIISQLCPPPFPELQEYCGCRRDQKSLLINYDIWSTQYDWLSWGCRGPFPEPNTTLRPYILSETQAAVACTPHYGNWLQPSVHTLLRVCAEVEEKWQQQIGFTCTMYHPRAPFCVERLQKWGFLWAEFPPEALFPLCRTLLWLELHTTPEMMSVIFFCQDFSCTLVY